jgi:hypothetical protein
MPVTFAQPPQQVAEVTRNKLQDMARQQHFRIASLAAAQPDQIEIASGHPVYNIGLQDLLSNKPLSSLPLTAWRFIVRSGATDAAAAETLTDPQQSTASFASVNSGPFVSGTIAALQSLSTDPAFAKGDWEGRMIRIPALFIMAIWAHEKASGEDIIRVSAPAPEYLDPRKSYTWDQFKAAVEGPAKQKLAFDDSPKS